MTVRTNPEHLPAQVAPAMIYSGSLELAVDCGLAELWICLQQALCVLYYAVHK
jgi:hypothetical protein